MSTRAGRSGAPTVAPADGLGFATEETYLRAIDGAARTRPTRAILTFVVGGETYGVGIEIIREIIKLREITEVPRAPHFLLGIISVRGAVIPVLDLRARLRLDPTPTTRAARILVALHQGEPYGLLVDAVSGVVRFPETDIEPTPAALTTGEDNFVAAIARYTPGGAQAAVGAGQTQAGAGHQAHAHHGQKKTRMVVLLNLEQVVSFEVKRRRGRGGREVRR